MARSLKLKNDDFIDSSGITHNRKKLSEILQSKRVSITTNYGCIYVYRYGNIVSIDIDGTIQESSGKIASDLPKAVYNYTYIKELGNQSYLRIDCNGNLYINSHTAGNWSNIHGIYICSDE